MSADPIYNSQWETLQFDPITRLTRFSTHGGKPDSYRSFLSNSVENFGRRIFGNIVSDLSLKNQCKFTLFFNRNKENLKIAESPCSFGMHHPFGDALSVEMSHILDKMSVLQQNGTSGSHSLGSIFNYNWGAMSSGSNVILYVQKWKNLQKKWPPCIGNVKLISEQYDSQLSRL